MDSLIDMRNADLFQAYKRKLKELGNVAKYMTRKSIVQLTVDSPAKAFYVAPETALKMISMINRSGNTGKARGLTEAKFIELKKTYDILKLAYPFLGKYALADMAVTSPAPKFYLDWEAALVIIYKMEKLK